MRPRKATNYRRSALEDEIEADLKKRKIEYEYEPVKFIYKRPEELLKYTPDFLILGKIWIEAKGWLDVHDRKKMLLVKESHPELDLRFVFQNPNGKIYKGSKTSYAQWATQHGFLWSKKTVPEEWLK